MRGGWAEERPETIILFLLLSDVHHLQRILKSRFGYRIVKIDRTCFNPGNHAVKMFQLFACVRRLEEFRVAMQSQVEVRRGTHERHVKLRVVDIAEG